MEILNASQTKKFKQEHGIGARRCGRSPKMDYRRLGIGESFLVTQYDLNKGKTRPYPTQKQFDEGIRASIRQFKIDDYCFGYICERTA